VTHDLIRRFDEFSPQTSKLPIAVPEQMLLGNKFHIKPLLPLLDDSAPFWLLTISGTCTRLFQGSRWSFLEVPGVDLPQGLAEIRGMTNYEETQYANPISRRGALAHAQSLGKAPDELRKTELLELLHRIAAAVEPYIKRNPAPMILAARPEIRGNFREVAGWKEIEPEGVSENPDALTPDELHRRARAVLEPKANEAHAAALEHLKALLPARKATTKADEIVKAGRYGRVDRLFLSGDG
jgi:hypothetical protein